MTDQKKYLIEELLKNGYEKTTILETGTTAYKRLDGDKLYLASFLGRFFLIECYIEGDKNSYWAKKELQRIKKTIKGGK